MNALPASSHAGGKRTQRLRIASWPYLSDTNKFIELLLGVSTQDVEISAVQSLAIIKPEPGTDIFLIHWPEFIFSRNAAAFPLRDARFALRRLRQWQEAGAKLVWMVHDLDPHDIPPGRKWIWRNYYRPRLANLIDAFVTLSPSTLEVARQEIPELRSKPGTYVLHPLYPDAAGTEAERQAARKTYCFQPSQKLIATIGFLGRYKGIDELLRVFSHSDDPDWRLVLAGNPKTNSLGFLQEMREAAAKDKRITVQARRLLPAELRHFTLAADLIVIPFRNYLHSGSILHALSARRPVLTPSTQYARDLQSHFPKGWIHLYEPPLTPQAIGEALKSCGTLTAPFPETLRIGANRDRLFDFFRELLGHPPVAVSPAVPLRIEKKDAPLVTLTLVNRNYAHYLGATIDSIRAQDYPNFECVMVDDASDDDSVEVMRRHAEGDSRFRIEVLPDNIGQLAGAIHAVKQARGDFIAMLDSDDCLLPDFITLHVQAHLASPTPVGLTSSGWFLISGEGSLLAGNENCISENPFSVPIQPEQLNDTRLSWLENSVYASLIGSLRLCERTLGGWIWAPGTANMFRRSAVEVGLLTAEGMKMETSYAADNHFLRIGHQSSGTLVIDLPLSLYRNHEKNKSNSLTRMQKFGRNSLHVNDRNEYSKIRLAAQVILKRHALAGHVPLSRLWPAVETIVQALAHDRVSYFTAPDIFHALASEYRWMALEFGEAELVRDMLRMMRPSDIWRLANSQPDYGTRLRAKSVLAAEIAKRPLARLIGANGW